MLTSPIKFFLRWSIVAIILAVLTTAVLAVFFRQNGKFSEIKNSEVPAGWQTYKDDKYGFEIKYPSDWKKVMKESGFSIYPPVFDPELEKAGLSEPGISIGIIDRSFSESICSRLLPEDWLNYEFKELVVDGVTGCGVYMEGAPYSGYKTEFPWDNRKKTLFISATTWPTIIKVYRIMIKTIVLSKP